MRQVINKKKENSNNFSSGILVFEDGTSFSGNGIGYEGNAVGEVCFNTSITGYQEIISDPSYAGQIINFTFPHIGNVGTNKQDNESDKVWTKGVILNTEITNPSNYRSLKHLDIWLKKNKIVGITGLDTRSLTNFIRDKGAPKGTISNNNGFGISCKGEADGSIDLSVSGGTANYTYAWTKDGDNTFSKTTQDIDGLGPGTYTVVVTDINDCSITESYTITQSPPLTYNLDSTKNITCNGDNDGEINITVTGGTGNYSYEWITSNGSGIQQGQQDQKDLQDQQN